MSAVNAFYKKQTPRDIANYLFLQFIIKHVALLDSRFVAAGYEFAARLDGGDASRESRAEECADVVVSGEWLKAVADVIGVARRSIFEEQLASLHRPR